MMKFRKYDLVVALYIFGVITANTLGAKTFPLVDAGGLHLTASVVIFVLPLLYTMTDVVIEVFGKKRAQSLVLSGLVVVALLTLYSLLSTSLPPSERFAETESAYDAIFSTSVRFSLASIAAFAISEFLDVAVFSKLREKMKKKALWLRNNVSNYASQLADSIVFFFLAFYAFNESFGSNLSFLFGLILPYWLIRCGLTVLETPLVYLGVRWLKPTAKAESAR